MVKAATAAILAAGFLAASTLQAAHSGESCVQCHVVHHASPDDTVPLWNGGATGQTVSALPAFALYSSSTFDALATDIGQPDGPSKLCLGCHDGSNSTVNAYNGGKGVFGQADLARSHPISFTYNSLLTSKTRGAIRDPSISPSGLGGTIARDLLDAKGKMQCTSCHDPHIGGKGQYMLRYDYNVTNQTDGVMCRVCHDK